MRISFIIPAHNEEALIEDCVASILREVARARVTAEIIVVDNASTDRTAEVVTTAFPNLRLVHESRKGIVWARQAGFLASRYEHVAFIDADNRLPPRWLDHARAIMQPGVVTVSGPLVYPDLPAWVRLGSRVFYLLGRVAHHAIGPMLQGGNFVVTRAALEAIGGFDTSVAFFGEDTTTAAQLAAVGKVRFVPALWSYSSGRRYAKEGVVWTTWRYVVNYIWVTFKHRPYNQDYTDVRQ